MNHSKPSRPHSRAAERNQAVYEWYNRCEVVTSPAAWPEETDLTPADRIIARWPAENAVAKVISTALHPVPDRQNRRLRRVYVVGLYIGDEYQIGRNQIWYQQTVENFLKALGKGNAE